MTHPCVRPMPSRKEAYRKAKDDDLHVLPVDVERSQQALRSSDFKVGIHHAQWLAQAHQGDNQICTIFGQGSWTYSNVRVVLVGWPGEEHLTREVADHAGVPTSDMAGLAGQTSLGGLAAI